MGVAVNYIQCLRHIFSTLWAADAPVKETPVGSKAVIKPRQGIALANLPFRVDNSPILMRFPGGICSPISDLWGSEAMIPAMQKSMLCVRERTMSQPLTDVESKLLFDKLNRRARLLKSLRWNPSRSPWYQIPLRTLFALFGILLMLFWVRSDGSWLVLLSGTVGMLVILAIEALIALTNSRIDGIIDLLQKDGVLDDPLTACRGSQSSGEPADNRTD
jgi:hypothetical protein